MNLQRIFFLLYFPCVIFIILVSFIVTIHIIFIAAMIIFIIIIFLGNILLVLLSAKYISNLSFCLDNLGLWAVGKDE